MLYDNYQKKIQRIAAFMGKIVRHLVLILSITGAIIAVSTTLLATKGLASRVECPPQVVYGESYNCVARAFLSDVRYQYKSADSDEWSENQPILPGDYFVRAVGESSFGNDRYGEESAFTILKKQLTVQMAEESITFGESPTVISDPLCYGDVLEATGYVFEDLSLARTQVTPDLSVLRIVNKSGEDVTHAYDVKAITSGIDFLKRPLTLHVYSSSKVYDSIPLICDTYDIIDGTTLGINDAIDVVFPSLSEAGVLENNPTLSIFHEVDGRRLNVTHQYDVTVLAGELKVEQRTAQINIHSLEATYTGKEIVCNDFDIDPEALVAGHRITSALAEAAPVDCGTYDNSLVFTINDQEGNDVTLNYWLMINKGTVKITAAPVTVTTEGGTWVYDGLLHSSDGYVVDGVLENHTVTVAPVSESEPDVDDGGIVLPEPDEEFTEEPVDAITEEPDIDVVEEPCAEQTPEFATIQSVGSVDNAVQIYVTDAEGRDVTSNYDITYVYGKLEVTPRPLTVTTVDESWVYDGALHSWTNVLIEGEAEGQTVKVVENATIQAVGTEENRVVVAVMDTERNDVTSNYEILYTFGKLEVVPRPLTVTTFDESWEYDATAHSCTHMETSGIVEGQFAKIVDQAYITDVGTSENRIEIQVFDENMQDVTANYEITYVFGMLEITPSPVFVTTFDESWVYDGKSHTGTLLNVEGLVDGHEVEITEQTSILNVGQAENRVVIIIKDVDGNDVTGNYKISYKYGTLEIIPRPMYVTTFSNSWVYDGEPHSYTKMDVQGLAEGHSAEMVEWATIIDVGIAENSIVVEVKDGDGNTVTSNYDIFYTYGRLEITPRIVYLEVEDVRKYYDGTPLYGGNYFIPEDTPYQLVSGHSITATVTGSRTNAGLSYAMIQEVQVWDEEGNEVTHNYHVLTRPGEIQVDPRPITVYTCDAEKYYDGYALTNTDYAVATMIEGAPLVLNHRIECDVIGYQVEIGSSTNIMDEQQTRIMSGYSDVTRNYEISYEYGTLTVKPNAIINIISDGDIKYYDGTPLVNGNYTTQIVEGELLPGHWIYVNVHGSITDPGKEPNDFDWCIYDWYYNDVSNYYTVNDKAGTLVVLEQPPVKVGEIKSDKGGIIYLRMHSYGDFNGMYWSDAVPYYYTLSGNRSYNYLTSLALANYGVEQGTVEFRNLEIPMLPYYMSINGSYIHPSSDTVYDEAMSDFTVPYYSLLEGEDNFEYLKGSLNSKYASLENEYRNFVYSNYLYVDYQTRSYLQDIINQQGFSKNDPSSILKAAAYIQNAAEYDLDYDKALDSEPNMVIAFLDQYKEGKCTHYATAATLLYRTMGIPARYVEGFMVETVKDEFVDIMTPGHAWVEVYIDGVGWIQVEVTGGSDDGSGNGFGGGAGAGGAGGGSDEESNSEIVVEPESCVKVYDGTALYPAGLKSDAVLEGLLSEGYWYQVNIAGEQTAVGTSDSLASEFRLFNPDGIDVTDQYSIVYRPGELEVIERFDTTPVGFGEIKNDRSGYLYLRMISYGNFNGKVWNPAVAYGKTLPGGLSYNYLSSIALENSGAMQHLAEFRGLSVAMLPYYMATEGSYLRPAEDVLYSGSYSDFTVPYYLIPDSKDSFDYLKGNLGELADYELEYREFVYQNYLQIDSETLAFMQSIIKEQGFSKDDPTSILKAASYIQNAAKYNLNYDPMLDVADNVAIAFLDQYKEGKCTHYATAATLLYRAMGIPARYVEGFMVETLKDEFVDIMTPGHAWVEVYIDGVGWIQVEVTGGSGEGGEGGEDGEGEGTGAGECECTEDCDCDGTCGGECDDCSEEEQLPLFVKPEDLEKGYDGLPLISNGKVEANEALDELLMQGYIYEATISGEQLLPGWSESVIVEFKLYDPDGNDVTDQYKLEYEPGKLTVLDSGSMGEVTPVKVGEIKNDRNGYVYLRMQSYGDFVGNLWRPAKPYGKTLPGGLSYNYLTSLALLHSGGNINLLEVKNLSIPMLPYYMGMDGDYIKPASDTILYQTGSKYIMTYYSIAENENGFDYLKGHLGQYEPYELDYRAFVYDNYLNVDEDTRAYLQSIIDEQGFSKDDPTSILAVAKYIQNAAAYNLYYDPMLDLSDNMVIAFLDQYKEGKCTHYATAATLLYRTMGIPARYVEGFMTRTVKNTFVDIMTPGHAWVEVYIDGVGWIQVEVTGSLGETAPREEITLTPTYCYKNYDGTPLIPTNDIELDATLSALLEQGYTYEVMVDGYQKNPGRSNSHILWFELFDPNGNNVTNRYEITYLPGTVEVFPGDQKFIRVYLYQLQKFYDGSPLAFEDEDYEIIEIPDGVQLELHLNISRTEAGMITLTDINSDIDRYVEYRAYKDGKDVTDEYVLIFDTFEHTSESYVPLRVDRRLITLTSASQTKIYDGEMLTNPQVMVTQGSLIGGHTLEAVASGYIITPGFAENTLEDHNIKVVDSEGRNVTYNYDIHIRCGILTVVPAEED